MRITHYGNKKINKLLKELEMYHLILRWHRGQGKPNRIYVNNVLVEDLNWSPVKAKTESLNVNDRRGWVYAENYIMGHAHINVTMDVYNHLCGEERIFKEMAVTKCSHKFSTHLLTVLTIRGIT